MGETFGSILAIIITCAFVCFFFKPPKCHYCGKPIKKGEPYKYQTMWPDMPREFPTEVIIHEKCDYAEK